MKYHVEFNNLDDCKKELEKERDAFDLEIEKFSKIKEELEWRGRGADAAITAFNDRVYRLSIIPKILNLYIKFMDLSINNYEEGYEEIKKNFDEILDEIDRIKGKVRDKEEYE